MSTKRQYKEYLVGCFSHHRKSGAVMWEAYLRDYNPEWKGCIEILVVAISGVEAKKLAIKEAKLRKTVNSLLTPKK